MKVAGEEVALLHDDSFRPVREFFSIPDGYLDGTNFDVSSLKPGGGKGGDLLGFTKCKQYIVKEVNKGDQKTLAMHHQRLCTTFCRESPTLLARLVMYFTMPSKPGRAFIAMTSFTPVDQKTLSVLYDLKGCQDDKELQKNGMKVESVHKRIWNVTMWGGQCMWTPERKAYYQSKQDAFAHPDLQMTNAQREMVLNAIELDCQVLRELDLMDYSIIAGVRTCSVEEGMAIHKEAVEVARRTNSVPLPLVSLTHDGKARLVYIGVIDYLQRWTWFKQAARMVKTFEPRKPTIPSGRYADRFVAHFKDKIKGGLQDPPDNMSVPTTQIVQADAPKDLIAAMEESVRDTEAHLATNGSTGDLNLTLPPVHTDS